MLHALTSASRLYRAAIKGYTGLSFKRSMCHKAAAALLVIAGGILSPGLLRAQGTWTPIATTAPENNAGVMILLPDGTVMVKTHGGIDGTGNVWNKLTPDVNGSYVHGTWSYTADMVYSRLYFSSQIMKDGRLYVAGGEYGTGKATCEIYDPVLDSWSAGPSTLHPSDSFFDANSEILPDGKILQAIVTGGSVRNYIYNPATNAYSLGPNSLKGHDESSWVKLPDNSVLYINVQDTTSERYIPAQNRWVQDDTLHDMLYDLFGSELGGAFLLPDGRVFVIGATNKTSYYTPSGDTTHGTWVAGPDIPAILGAPDAAATMMVNGKILCAFSPVPTSLVEFSTPTYFYEFDYVANTFTAIHAPMGGDTMSNPCYYTNMLCLPDGSIMYGTQGSTRYYVYKPAGAPLAAGKPVISAIKKIDCYTYMATGYNFNGISEGACYGDDWQNATNYPLVRLTDEDGAVTYARTYNWNSTGVMTGSLPDTTMFSVDPFMAEGHYKLELVVNGNPSDSFAFTTCYPIGVATVQAAEHKSIYAYPNPATNETNIVFDNGNGGKYDIRIVDVLGRTVKADYGTAAAGEHTHMLPVAGTAKGIYTVIVHTATDTYETKIAIK